MKGCWHVLFPSDETGHQALSPAQVNVKWREAWSGFSSTDRLASLHEAWRFERVKSAQLQGKVPHDGPTFRLADLKLEGSQLTIGLQRNHYSDYLGVRVNPEMLDWASNLSQVDPLHPELPNVLGNSAVILTSDGFSVLAKRTAEVSTFSGYLDLPGGHPEPGRVFGDTTCKVPSSDVIVRELFDAVERELHEETGITPGQIERNRLIGLLSAVQDGGKPNQVFLVELGLSIGQVMGQLNRFKTNEIDSFQGINITGWIGEPDQMARCTPASQGALSIAAAFLQKRER